MEIRGEPMRTDSPEHVGQRAVHHFASGLFCAESVVLALAEARGVESELLSRVATPFCSGMSRTCGQCGALSGALLAVGLCVGRSSAGQSVEPAYDVAREVIRQFEAEFGARNCDELLGCDLGTPEGQTVFKEEKLYERCRIYTGRAAEIAARALANA